MKQIHPSVSPQRRRAGLWATAALAALTGTLCAEAVTHACDCVTPVWTVHLVSVSTSDGATHHEAHWPLEARLTSWKGTAILRNTHRHEDTVLDYVRGGSR